MKKDKNESNVEPINVEVKTNIEPKPKKKGKVMKRILKGFLICGGIIIVTGVSAVGYGYYKYGDKIEAVITDGYKVSHSIDITDFNTRKPTQFYDANGKLLKEFKTNTYYYTKKEDTNPLVFKAFTSIEDERFYEHKGIDYKGLERSVWVFLKSKGHTLQGGSTITQQLSRNVYLTLDQNMWRKLEEMVVSTEMEKKFSKDQILEFYVNNINFGYGNYSIESASQYYFQKSSKDLDLAQITTLVAIPNNPTIYNPVKHMDNVVKRKNLILDKMLELGQITQEEYDKAKTEEVKLNVKPDEKSEAMDYAMQYAVYNATRDLMEADGFVFRYNFDNDKDRNEYFDKYNDEYAEKEKQLLSGRYKIDTSIDMNKQQKLQEVVDEKLAKYTQKDEKTGLYKKQGASVTIDNSTGEVVAIVGGRSQEGNTFNRGFLGVRQPGSSMKPLVAYTPAFERGYIPSSKYNDAPINQGPQNDDYAYRGIVPLKYAVDISINTIPFRLVNENGVKNSLQYLQNMEFKYLTPDDNTPIVAIGGLTKGVTTVEMASGYSTLERNGEFIRPTNVKKITDQVSNEVIYENKSEKIKVYDSGASYLMTDTLKSVLTEPYSTGRGLVPSNYPYVAGKTGTTDDSKDCWFVGYSPYYSTSVWVGDDIPAKQDMFGANEPGHIWKEYMEYLHEGLEQKDFEKPDTVTEKNGVLVDSLYLEAQQEQSRLGSEQSRIRKENQEQLTRLNREDYRIKYGLTEEEETAYEKSATEAIKALVDFSLIDKTQYAQIDQLVQTASTAVSNVKHQDAYNSLKGQLEDRLAELNRIKYSIDNPPIQAPVEPEQPNNNEGTPTDNNNTQGNTGGQTQPNGNTPTNQNPTNQTPTNTTPTTNPNGSGDTNTTPTNNTNNPVSGNTGTGTGTIPSTPSTSPTSPKKQ
jgi:Membrane carboxypeptidase (penicillin-binding protein)